MVKKLHEKIALVQGRRNNKGKRGYILISGLLNPDRIQK